MNTDKISTEYHLYKKQLDEAREKIQQLEAELKFKISEGTKNLVNRCAKAEEENADLRQQIPRWIPVSEAEDMQTYLIDGDTTTAYLYSAFDDVFTGGNDEIPASEIKWILDIAKLPTPPGEGDER